jgi:hypothetical protein
LKKINAIGELLPKNRSGYTYLPARAFMHYDVVKKELGMTPDNKIIWRIRKGL